MDKITCLLVGVALGVVINKQLECKRQAKIEQEQRQKEECYKNHYSGFLLFIYKNVLLS